ncbi:aldose 1-epimerase [Azospirillum halopraeferens]|uniref:aldose 1-epimerase n=1 Tax=Azospirillum halopraeferens TaxID=34010 RepID=UPI000415BF21|nr:aldose 1-epimerase [Azospirillum halopraeferens]
MPERPDTVVLRHGDLETVVCPAVGGSLGRLTLHTPAGPVELMRPTPPNLLGAGCATDHACFPLVPFSNRVAGGRFRFADRAVVLPLNRPGCPHAIHGHAWQAPWTVEERTPDRVRLTFRHGADAWPWSYAAVQTFVLSPDRLTVDLELVNESPSAMPAGFGLHPYLPKPPGTVLTAAVDGVWLTDVTLLPAERVPVPEGWRFAGGTVLDDVVVDNGFTGWNGRAALDWPAAGRRLVMEAQGPFGHLVVYAPRGEDYVCIEPVTHMTDAVNHPGEPDGGVVPLEPGERLTGRVTFRTEPL